MLTWCRIRGVIEPRQLAIPETQMVAFLLWNNFSSKLIHIIQHVVSSENQLPVNSVSFQVSDAADPLVFSAVSHVHTRSLIHSGMPEHMITISQNGIVGLHDWLPYSKTRAKPFTFEPDPSLSSNRQVVELICCLIVLTTCSGPFIIYRQRGGGRGEDFFRGITWFSGGTEYKVVGACKNKVSFPISWFLLWHFLIIL